MAGVSNHRLSTVHIDLDSVEGINRISCWGEEAGSRRGTPFCSDFTPQGAACPWIGLAAAGGGGAGVIHVCPLRCAPAASSATPPQAGPLVSTAALLHARESSFLYKYNNDS